MFKVSNKDTRTTTMASFWYLYCELCTYVTPCSCISIVKFEQVITGWVCITLTVISPEINNFNNLFQTQICEAKMKNVFIYNGHKLKLTVQYHEVPIIRKVHMQKTERQ